MSILGDEGFLNALLQVADTTLPLQIRSRNLRDKNADGVLVRFQ